MIKLTSKLISATGGDKQIKKQQKVKIEIQKAIKRIKTERPTPSTDRQIHRWIDI